MKEYFNCIDVQGIQPYLQVQATFQYFNSFDDIQFFTFSSISRDMKMVTLNEIHRYIQNFMLYKMIFFEP